ncbi:MAG: xanthine dehydrogenase small subunit [Candidatus Pseudothioglobus sp.]|jgi:xanthine dehydrogenase small subunit
MKIWINQQVFDLDGPADETVLRFLRRQGLRGTKEGCASGDCGACTVMLVGLASAANSLPGDDAYTTFNACIAPIGQYAGRQLVTVEGLARGDQLHPAQQAMVDCHGSQCGYCTPGFVMSLAAMVENRAAQESTASLLDNREANTDQLRAAVEQGISGNLCRCTGYRPIVDAGIRALAVEHQSWLEIASIDAPPMLSTAPGVLLPETVNELAQLRQQYPDAQLIAGGTDIMLTVTQQYQAMPSIISLKGVAELQAIDVNETVVFIGAAATYRQIEQRLGHRSRQLVRLLHRLGSAQIRYQGTLGGNFGTGSPIADMPPAFMVLDAQLVLGGTETGGAPIRRVPVEAFYRGYRETDLGANEYILGVECAPSAFDDFHRFYKNSKRIEDDISSVMGAFRFCGSPQQLSLARIAFGGMAATPLRMPELEAMLVGGPLDKALISKVAAVLAKQLQPLTDVRATAAYRLMMAQQMLVRALSEYQGEHFIDITEAV